MTLEGKWLRIAVALAIFFSFSGLQIHLSGRASASPLKLAAISISKLQVKSPEKDFPVRDVVVMSPKVPAAELAELPVVYMLHGWPGTPSGLIAGIEQPLNDAFANGETPFIAVFPDGNATTHVDSEWADSYDKSAMVETWLIKNVIPTVEGSNIRDRSDRAILGFSMGGYGASIIALHHPELFSRVISLAGYFVVDDLTNAFGTEGSSTNKIAYQTPKNFLKVAKKLTWYLGESPDDYTELIRGQAASWGNQLKSVKAKYQVVYAPGGHSYTFVANEVPSLLKWLKWAPINFVSPLATTSASPVRSPSPSPQPKVLFN